MHVIEMDFARAQLEKYGWKEGSGIGKTENGIKEAIKVKFKFDTTGIGHDQAEEFKYNWWEQAYNKAADSFKVNQSDDGVAVEKTEEFEISRKRPLPHSIAKKKKLYGFVQSKTLNNTDKIPDDSASRSDSDSSSDGEENNSVKAVTDEDLYKICEGRTAHKGARHGLRLNGKLKRIMEQESNHSTKEVKLGTDQSEELVRSKKKKKKTIRIDNEEMNKEDCSTGGGQIEETLLQKRKKSKKDKCLSRNDSCASESNLPDSALVTNMEHDNVKKKKKKKKRKHEHDDGEPNTCDSEIKCKKSKMDTEQEMDFGSTKNEKDQCILEEAICEMNALDSSISASEEKVHSPVKKKKKSKKQKKKDIVHA